MSALDPSWDRLALFNEAMQEALAAGYEDVEAIIEAERLCAEWRAAEQD